MNLRKPSVGEKSAKWNETHKGNGRSAVKTFRHRPGIARRPALASPLTRVRKHPEPKEALDRAHDYAQAIVEAVPPLLVLDPDLRVVTANGSFCKAFKISSRQTLNRRVEISVLPLEQK